MGYINFEQIPLDILTPGNFVEFSNERAVRGLALMPHKILVFGQKLASGIAPANTPILLYSKDQAAVLGGRGSMMHRMVAALKRVNQTTELWGVFLDDDAAGNLAAGSVTLTGPATAAGTYALYIDGVPVRIAVASAATADATATALAAAINANADLSVTAAVDGEITSKVVLTAKHKGLAGNAISIRTNYFRGEVNPAGLTEVIVGMAGGTQNPDVTDVFTSIGAEWYTTYVMPYTDAANLTALEGELARRTGPLVMTDAIAYTGSVGSQGALVAFGTGRNTQHVSCIGVEGQIDAPEEWAAAYAGAAAFAAEIDPAQPVSDIELTGLKAPAIGDRFTREQRDVLLKNGIATWTVNPAGNVVIERAVTMYRLGSTGLPDRSYLDTETLRTLSYLRYTMRVRLAARYRRKKLGKDGSKGPNVVTPKTIRGEMIALFKDWEELGLVQDIEQFKRDLIVEISDVDPNRVNVLIPAHVINQLRVIAGQIQFIL
jgi:phage tail sheath gpL-like